MDGGLSRRFRMGLNDPQLVNAVFEEIRQRIGENNYNSQRWLADHGLQQSELGVAISRMSGDDLSARRRLPRYNHRDCQFATPVVGFASRAGVSVDGLGIGPLRVGMMVGLMAGLYVAYTQNCKW